ncbi:hypothetical protein [Bacillus cereus]|nr:hypothetical protein [Bacillus cereus]
MSKKKYSSIDFEEVPSMIGRLRGESGLYIFRTPVHQWERDQYMSLY